MPSDQAEVPDFLKRHNIRADSILFNQLCGYKRGDWGLIGINMLETYGSQAQLALMALLTLYGFNEDVISAFKRPVSSSWLLNCQKHAHGKLGSKSHCSLNDPIFT